MSQALTGAQVSRWVFTWIDVYMPEVSWNSNRTGISFAWWCNHDILCRLAAMSRGSNSFTTAGDNQEMIHKYIRMTVYLDWYCISDDWISRELVCAYLYFVSACNVSSVHCISYSWCSSHKYVANFQAKYVPQRCFYYYSSCNVLLMWAVMISSCSFCKWWHHK